MKTKKNIYSLLLAASLLFAGSSIMAQGNSGKGGKTEVHGGANGKVEVKGNGKIEVKENSGHGTPSEHGKTEVKGSSPEKENGNGSKIGAEGSKDKADVHGSKGNANGHDKENNGQGNAYGQDKGDLTGREFGQQRAAEARAKAETNVLETEKIIVAAQSQTSEARVRIEAIKLDFEAEKKSGKLTVEAIKAKEGKIKVVEAKIVSLEEAAKKEKENLEKLKIQVAK